MARAYYDRSDTDLLSWANTASGHLSASPASFYVTAAQADDFEALVNAFSNALAAWRDNTTRTPVASANKSSARKALLDGARYVVATVNSNPLTTGAQRAELGISARKRPTPIDPPTLAPTVEVDEVSGRTVTFKLVTPGLKRGRPAGVQGAGVFVFVGATAPTDPSAFVFETLVTKTTFKISFEDRTAADTAWVSACWYNETGQTGVACTPIRVNLPAAVVRPMVGAEGNPMKIAA